MLKFFNTGIDFLNYKCYHRFMSLVEQGASMARDWYELTKLTQGMPLTVERVRLTESDIGIEGSFELPPLARLSAEDQVFVAAFVRCHGSIKQMEQWFGVSYPTIKNRLNRISDRLGLVEFSPAQSRTEIVAQLERGDITAQQAIERLKR